jgi:hypothetical protein
VSNNITIKDGSNANVTLHTIEDATSVHFNQSIPTDINNNVATVVSGGQAVASGMGALVVAQRDALPAGTNHLGKVSIVGSVSIQQTGALYAQVQGQYSATPPTLVDTTVSTLQVDSRGSLRVTLMSPDSNGGIGKTSSFTDANVNNQNRIAAETYPMVFNRASSTWDRLTGTSVGLAVTQAGTWSVSVGDKVSVAGLVAATQSGTWGVNLNGAVVSNPNTAIITAANGALYTAALTYGWDGANWRRVDIDTNGKANVSISNTLNIGVSVANTINVATHAVTQSGAWAVSVSDKVSVAGLVGLNAGTNLIGAVSISPNGLNIPVSVASTGAPSGDGIAFGAAQSLRTMAATYVHNRISDTWDRMSGTSVGIYVQGNASAGAANLGRMLPVGGTDGTNNRTLLTTTGGALVVHVSNTAPGGGAGGTTQLVSVGGAVSTQGVQIVGRDGSGNARVPYVDASGIARVSIEGSLAVSGSSMTQTVGAAVTTEGYPMLGSDGSNARRLLTTTGGALVVHISNALPAAGASMLQTVGAAVTTEGYPMLGSDGTNARRLLTTTGGALVVHVSNSAPGGAAAGSTQLVSVGGAVSTQGVQVVGVDGANNARTFLTDTTGRIAIASIGQKVAVSVNGGQIVGQNNLDGQSTQQGLFVHNQGSVFNRNSNTWDRMTGTSVGLAVIQGGTWAVGLNAGTALVGAVSISPNGLNLPVSVAGTITVGTHAVTQSGAWAVSVSDKVSVAGLVAATQSGTWNVGLNAGTALIGSVSISPNGLNIPVSLAPPTFNVPVSAASTGFPNGDALGLQTANSLRVMNAGFVYNKTSDTWDRMQGTSVGIFVQGNASAGATNLGRSLIVGGTDGTNNRTLLTTTGGALVVHVSNTAPGGGAGGSAMTHTVGAAVTTEGYPMLGSDGANSRRLLTTTGGALVVHISNALPAAGASMLQTVGAAVTNQGYPMLGTDGTNARGLLTTTGGALIVHVSNSAPGGGGGGGGTVMASIGGAVSNQAVQIAGSDTQNNARTIKTNVSGAVFISTRTFMSQATFSRPADTTAYAAGATAAPGNAGDLIANSTTAGSVTPLKFRVARSTGQNGGIAYIRGARMFRTGGGLATGQHNIAGAIRLHLFNTNNRVSVAGGDNAAFNASPVSSWMGYIDLVAIACAPGLRTSGAVSTQVYWGSPARTGEMLVNLSATQVSIQGLLETRIAFTPISGEIFTVQIEGFNG